MIDIVQLTQSWPWYLTRASGVVAALLLILLILSGVSMFTGHLFKFMEPLKAWANHRVIGIALTVCLVFHIVPLLFDTYISFNVLELVVPFASDYKQLTVAGIAIGSLGVALGVISLYLVIGIVYTSLTAIRTKQQSLWKITHYLSYAVVALVFFHSILIGTDIRQGVLRFSWIGLNLVVLSFVLLRLSRVGSLKRS